MENNILVVGSLNMDLNTKVKTLPGKGETVFGEHFYTVPGGKGLNQAVSASRSGGNTWILGKIGNDYYGKLILEQLEKSGLNTELIKMEENTETGKAVINVDERGNNTIVVIPGANSKLSIKDIDDNIKIFNKMDSILLQIEIPKTVVFHTIEKTYDLKQTNIILDPTPVTEIPDNIYKKLDIITPNLTEAEQLSGYKVKNQNDYKKVSRFFINKGVKNVLLTIGDKGVFVKNKDIEQLIKGVKVKSTDSTAAGDCFVGAFASRYTGNNLIEAVEFANYAAALSTTKKGAVSSLPNKIEIFNFRGGQQNE